ncbi:MAG: EAL domain-containing protein [Betaproteobacteria bacterium]
MESTDMTHALEKNPLSGLLSAASGWSAGSGSIDKILHAVRTHLGMDVAFVAEFRATDRVFRHVDAQDRSPIHAGDAASLENGYCQRVIDGRLPELIPDTSAVAEAMALQETIDIPIGSHISVPIRLADGRLYGTFCCFGFAPDATLCQRDLRLMKAFADLAADQIDHDLNNVQKREEKIHRITAAVANGQPSIVYQPVYDLETNRIAGVEGLSRFQGGLQRTPDVWFSEAADVGLGVALELQAISMALAGLDSLSSDIYLAINSSPETIISGALTEALRSVQAERVVVEITEHNSISDYAKLLEMLVPLRALGVRIAIDDAGAGYASMRHILSMQPDLIKLDMSLTRNIDKDSNRRALASALIAFARETNNVIVAEGVETESELYTLQNLGVERAQGYFLSRPLALADAIQLPINDHRRSAMEYGFRPSHG